MEIRDYVSQTFEIKVKGWYKKANGKIVRFKPITVACNLNEASTAQRVIQTVRDYLGYKHFGMGKTVNGCVLLTKDTAVLKIDEDFGIDSLQVRPQKSHVEKIK